MSDAPEAVQMGVDPSWFPEDDDQEEASPKKERRPNVGGEEQKKSKAALIVELLGDAPRFHDSRHQTYVTLEDGRTVRTRSGDLRRWLAGAYWRAKKDAPSTQALSNAIAVIEGQARFEGEERVVPVRVHGDGERILLDLGDDTQRVIEVTSAGWQVADPDDVDVTFLRTPGMLPLPVPIPGGSLEMLRPHLNIEKEDFPLIVSWLLAALRPGRPAPIDILLGEQGSAKSTTQRMLRSLIDPNSAPLRSAPRSERDLAIAASNAHVMSFDNFSKVTPKLSDALCRLATGGGFATRTLYTDQDETLFDSMRPIIVNGISNFVTRGDLLDRSIVNNLPVIATDERKPERLVWREFEEDRPAILGALLDAVVAGLGGVEDVHLTDAPRMADYAEWVVACSPALPFSADEFLSAYTTNRADATTSMLTDDVAGSLILELTYFEGTAGELLDRLRLVTEHDHAKQKMLPSSPQGMGWVVRRLAPALRQAGMTVEFLGQRGSSRARTILIARRESGEAEEDRSIRSDRSAPSGARTPGANDVANDPSDPEHRSGDRSTQSAYDDKEENEPNEPNDVSSTEDVEL